MRFEKNSKMFACQGNWFSCVNKNQELLLRREISERRTCLTKQDACDTKRRRFSFRFARPFSTNLVDSATYIKWPGMRISEPLRLPEHYDINFPVEVSAEKDYNAWITNFTSLGWEDSTERIRHIFTDPLWGCAQIYHVAFSWTEASNVLVSRMWEPTKFPGTTVVRCNFEIKLTFQLNIYLIHFSGPSTNQL